MTNKNKISGFTLVELITVLIIIGILAATAIPRFFNVSGFDQHSYSAELVSVLRAVQLRAMQQTSSDTCQSIKVTSTRVGLPKTDTDNADNCHLTDWPGVDENSPSVIVDSDHQITFASSDVVDGEKFSFDHLGKPTGCNNPCDITINGLDATPVTIRIESEGYVHEL